MTWGGWHKGTSRTPSVRSLGTIPRCHTRPSLIEWPFHATTCELCNLVLKQPEPAAATSIGTRRLPSPEALATLRKQLVADRDACPRQVIVSSGTCGEARGSLAVVGALRAELANQGLAHKVLVRVTGCHGFCEQEPMVIIQPGNILYCRVCPDDAGEIVSQTVARGDLIDRLLYTDHHSGEKLSSETTIPFYAAQDRLLLGQNKWLDPESIDDAIANGAYSALSHVLAFANPEHVIEEIKRSGLRGLAGNGLLAGPMWETVRITEDKREKYVVCCVDEGDPAAHIDRNILESNPHAVLEGMIIGAYAIGANAGLIRLRTEHRLALQHAWLAVDHAREYGLLGDNILDSGFSLDVDIGQRTRVPLRERSTESASDASPGIEPLFLEGPSHLDSAEAWASVPGIVNHGASWFADWGFGECAGTKILSLSGPIKNTGFVEVPLGMSLRTIVLDIGGGIRNGRKLKAVQTGGPSGGCLPVNKFNLSVDFDSLAKAGSILGSGGIVAMGCDTCMVDVAKRSLVFLQEESCGKCTSCRRVLGPMLEIVTDITERRGHSEQLGLLEELGKSGGDASSCALSKAASSPVLSTLKYFRNEYDAHIQDGRCPAGVCRALVRYTIQEKQCHGCGRCGEVCPENAITGEENEPHTINPNVCTKCGVCRSLCEFDAITVV